MKILLLFFTLSSFAQDVLPIIKIGDPILRNVAHEVDLNVVRSQEFQKLVEDMTVTMKKAGGVGLAGPQVNHSLRLFMIKENLRFIPLTIMINPIVTPLEEHGQVKSIEGCLSVKGRTIELNRWKKIQISFYDRSGKFVSEEYSRRRAIISQHEFDHINGVLIVDHEHGSN